MFFNFNYFEWFYNSDLLKIKFLTSFEYPIRIPIRIPISTLLFFLLVSTNEIHILSYSFVLSEALKIIFAHFFPNNSLSIFATLPSISSNLIVLFKFSIDGFPINLYSTFRKSPNVLTSEIAIDIFFHYQTFSFFHMTKMIKIVFQLLVVFVCFS